MAVMIFDQPAEALTSKLAKGLSYIAEQSGNNWILPTGTNAVSGDFISVDGIMGQATAAIVGGTDAIVEGTNWSQCPSGALNAVGSKYPQLDTTATKQSVTHGQNVAITVNGLLNANLCADSAWASLTVNGVVVANTTGHGYCCNAVTVPVVVGDVVYINGSDDGFVIPWK